MTHRDTLTVTQRPPAAGVDPTVHRHRWRILGVVSLSLVIIGLDNTILNVALPTVQRELAASAQDLQWVVDAYILAFAGLLLLAGNLGDRYGRKWALQLGLLVFAAGSTLAVLSDTTSMLLVARAVMGVGAAFIMPATLSIISNVFTGEERARAIGLWAACAGIGTSLGPVVGGWLLDHFWLGSVFMINLPVVGAALFAGLVLVPNSKDPAVGRLDPAGAALSIAGVTSLIYGIIAAPSHGWTSASVLGAFLAAAAFMVAFIAVELRVDNPMLPLWFFRNPRFSAACISLSLVFFALLGSLYFLTQYLQVVKGYSALAAGLRTLPIAVGLAVAAPRGARLAARHGTKPVVASGLLLTAVGLATFALVSTTSSYALVFVALAAMGVGMGTTMAPATESIMGSVPPSRAGVGSAVNDAVRQLGGALGVAVLGSILAARYANGLTPTLERLVELPVQARSAATDSVSAAHSVASANGGAAGARVRELADSAFVSAMNTTVLIAAGVAVLGAVVVLVFLPARQLTLTDPPGTVGGAPLGERPRGTRNKHGRHRRPPHLRPAPLRPVTVASAGVLGAVLVAASLLSARALKDDQASAASVATGRTEVMHLTQRVTSLKQVDVGDSTRSAGDQQFLGHDILRGRDRVAQDVATCSFVDVSPAGRSALCALVMRFTNGDLTMQGAASVDITGALPPQFTFVITGGTGSYDGVIGRADFKEVVPFNEFALTLMIRHSS